MKTLNQKGLTTIELLVCFVLISILSVSMYETVTNYKEKQQIESMKTEITTYKNLLTKEIQDNIIQNQKIVKVKKESNTMLNFTIGNLTKVLVLNYNNDKPDEISYGDITNPLPDLGKDERGNYDLKIDREKSYLDYDETNQIIEIYIVFTHPDLGEKYAIHIVDPLTLT